jgi:hypothetical protein
LIVQFGLDGILDALRESRELLGVTAIGRLVHPPDTRLDGFAPRWMKVGEIDPKRVGVIVKV